jgi:hypothetical protein
MASELDRLKQAGFDDGEITSYIADKKAALSSAGFTDDEINSHLGIKAMKLEKTSEFIAKAFEPFQVGVTPDITAPTEITGTEKPAIKQETTASFIDALNKGFGASVSGLQIRQTLPEQLNGEDATRANRIAYQLAQITGDIPYMITGFAMGATAATAVTGPAAVVAGPILGAGGAFAVPEALRTAYIDSLQKGEITSLSDYLDRMAAMTIAGAKGFVTGAVSRGAGMTVSSVIPATVPTVIATTADLGAEIATMVTVSKALEGEMPHVQDFEDAALLIAGIKLSGSAATKLQTIYKESGVKPTEAIRMANEDPNFKQTVLANNMEEVGSLNYPEIWGVYGGPKRFETVPDPKGPYDTNIGVKDPVKTFESKPDPQQELTDAQKAIMDKVKSTDPKYEMPSFDELIANYTDKMHPFKVAKELLGGKDIEASKDPYKLARLTAGNIGRADAFLEHGSYEFGTLEKNGMGLKEVLEPVRKDIDGFTAYAIAARAVELEGRGITSGFDIDAARTVVEQTKGKYAETFKNLQDFQNNATKYLRDAGLVSAENYDLMLQANQNYVPLYRAFEGAATPSKTRGLNVRNPIKKIKGSELDIVNPIESIVKNTYLFIDIAEKNRVRQSLVDLIENAPEGQTVMERVTAPIRPIEITKSEIGKIFEAHGIENIDPETASIFRPNNFTAAKDEIAVYRDGKREVYKVSQELANAANGLDASSTSILMKILSAPASLLRAGVTLSPDFMARNVTRDQFVAFIQGNGYVPIYHSLVGLKDIVTKSDDYYSWLKSGGANSAMVSLDRNYIKSNILKLSEETGFMDATWNVIKSPVEMLRVASELMENSTRVGAFKSERGDNVSLDSQLASGLASRDVTMDFAKMGAKIKAVNQISAFFNARIQGPVRMYEALRDNPLETVAKSVASITVPSILLWFNNKDDPRYQELPDWQKDLFWIIPTKDTLYRVPKPFEYGLMFGTLPERVLNAYYKDKPKEEMAAFMKTFSQMFAFDAIPTFALPMLEQWANKSYFTGRPIVPHDAEKQLPEYQYSPNTNMLIRQIGTGVSTIATATGSEWLRFSQVGSPAVIENYVRSWTGNLGMSVMNLAERGLIAANVIPDPVRPEDTLADIPFVKAFAIRYPGPDAKSITDFYDKYKKHEVVMNTIKAQAKAGNADAVEKELNLSFNQKYLIGIDGIQKTLGEHSKTIRMITKNPQIPANEKRQMIDQLYYGMINAAKLGNDTMDQLEGKTEKK